MISRSFKMSFKIAKIPLDAFKDIKARSVNFTIHNIKFLN